MRWREAEKFAVVLPDTNGAGARLVAERLREAVELQACATAHRHPVTVSVGVAEIAASAERFEQALARAGAALYQAKAGGRNRTCIGGDVRE